ncbi:nucleoside diphosphate kinase [Micromonospora pisi]|uniref:Nucleoside diphosphate kinase n=1 Tax=Micromonospora pisi TaxID=589240 RepID=A0A495JSP1_9ACTN|nr:nucleoside-diphosphate kinase [Micromonospora pisi]RKR91089.1 nucleoside diphosphate kinase [Micromonospora pisi]
MTHSAGSAARVLEMWRALTADAEKLRLYQQEPYLAMGVDAAARALGPAFEAKLQRMALLVIQADVIAERRVGMCLDFVRDHGFVPISATPFLMSPEMTGEIWRYQFDMATPDSRELCDLYCAKAESLLVVLADHAPDGVRPASVRLTQLKGPSNPARRSADSLRTTLGATNRIVCAVHCSDEPIDLLRETAIMVPDRLLELYIAIADVVDRGVQPYIEEQVSALYRRAPRHDIDVGHAMERLLARIPVDSRDRAVATAAARLRDSLPAWQRRERFLPWSQFSADLSAIGVEPTSWDALLVASEYVEYDLTGVDRTLHFDGGVGWVAGEGQLLAP